MLKALLVIVFFGTSISCFSEELAQPVKESNLYDESLALVYIGCGNANLLAHNYSSALGDFERASSLLDEHESPEMAFFISFGKAIVYDNLGLREQCQNAIGSLFLILNEGRQEEKEDHSSNDDILQKEYEEATNLMKQLAELAPTPNVREILLGLVEELSEELLPSLAPNSAPFGALDRSLNMKYNDFSPATCKSFWKKAERFAKRAYKVFLQAKAVWDFIKDVEKTLNNNDN